MSKNSKFWQKLNRNSGPKDLPPPSAIRCDPATAERKALAFKTRTCAYPKQPRPSPSISSVLKRFSTPQALPPRPTRRPSRSEARGPSHPPAARPHASAIPDLMGSEAGPPRAPAPRPPGHKSVRRPRRARPHFPPRGSDQRPHLIAGVRARPLPGSDRGGEESLRHARGAAAPFVRNPAAERACVRCEAVFLGGSRR
jgi:hypothetical protein